MWPIFLPGGTCDECRRGDPSAPQAVATAAPANASLEEHEKKLVMDALNQAAGNQSKAARQLRIGRDALRYKMKKFGLL